jgi:YceI-like domain
VTLIEERVIARQVGSMPQPPAHERFDVQSANSSLTFTATSSSFPVYGKVAEMSGYVEGVWHHRRLALDPSPQMHVEFQVESLRTGNDLQDREMWKLIDSKRFPKILADLGQLSAGSVPDRYAAVGEITLAGLARRYEGSLTLRRDGELVSIDGDINIDVRHFGLKPMNLLVLSVEPLVRVRLRLLARKAP